MNKRKRFIPLKNHKGIRKDTHTGQYVARKRVGPKQFCKTFWKISDAVQWRRNFHPLLSDAEVKGTSVGSSDYSHTERIQQRLNGVDQRFTFGQVWGLYRQYHLPTLQPQSVERIVEVANRFFPELINFKMQEINSELLDSFMKKKVADAIASHHNKRVSFNSDLRRLRAVLNWYRENYDSMFMMPILKRHYAQGIIRKVPKRNIIKMNMEQIQQFLDSFNNSFWRDFAEMHFFMAGRVQEAAGIQWESVDLEKKILYVKDVLVWGQNKKIAYLKEVPKNEESRIVCLNGRMIDILQRCWRNKSKTPCPLFRESTKERLDFVFEQAGNPVSYRSVQYQYNKALKTAGLFPKFSSTHILRKAMANIVRQELGLDAAQAAGGWKSRAIVERTYTDAPNLLNRQAVNHVEQLFMKSTPTPRKKTKSHLTLLRTH